MPSMRHLANRKGAPLTRVSLDARYAVTNENGDCSFVNVRTFQGETLANLSKGEAVVQRGNEFIDAAGGIWTITKRVV